MGALAPTDIFVNPDLGIKCMILISYFVNSMGNFQCLALDIMKHVKYNTYIIVFGCRMFMKNQNSTIMLTTDLLGEICEKFILYTLFSKSNV